MALRQATLSMCDGPFGSSLKSSHYREVGIRVVRLQNIGNGLFRDEDAAYVEPKYFHSLGRHDARPGDLLMAGLGDENHPVGRACVVPDYLQVAMVKADCFRIRLDPKRLLAPFAAYFLSSNAARAGFAMLSRGATRERINLTGAAAIGVPAPPLGEQKAITNFLDCETAKIDALIAKQTEFLKLLNEHRRALITEAVTHGIDLLVPKRKTGVETFPVVPDHWQVRPLKHVIRRGTSISYGIVQPGDHDPDGVPFVQTADLTQRRLDPSLLPRTAPEIARAYPRSRLAAGDVLLGIRASVGDSVIVPTALEGANLSRGIARIVPASDINPNYLVLVFNTPQTAWFWTLHMQGSTFREVSIETVRQLPIPVPPRHEQDSIVCYLQERLIRFDFARDRSTEMIERLRERRAALITAAVTGQINVTEPTLTEAAA